MGPCFGAMADPVYAPETTPLARFQNIEGLMNLAIFLTHPLESMIYIILDRLIIETFFILQ